MKVQSIAIIGAESSGKTTLSKELGEFFGCPVVYEYAREYLEEKNGNYTYEDIEIIAKEQVKKWFGTILQQPQMMIVDTELTVLKVWSELKFRKTSPWLEEHYENQNIDLYLLCQNDLEWQVDPLRENESIEERNDILNKYKEELIKHKRSFIEIRGSGEQRLKRAKDAIKKHFEK